MQYGALPHINDLEAPPDVEAHAHRSFVRPVQSEARASTDPRRQPSQRLDDIRVEAAPREGRTHGRFLERAIGIVGEMLKRAAAASAEVSAGGRLPHAKSEDFDDSAEAALVARRAEPCANAVAGRGER